MRRSTRWAWRTRAIRAGFALSSGMRARLQLARSLLHRPRVLILDEPTGTVDPVDAQKLLELIQRLTHEQGLAVLISSHRLEEIDALSDNVAFLDRGRLVHWGDLDSLRALWEAPRVVLDFATQPSAAAAASRLERSLGTPVDVDGTTLRVETNGGAGPVLSALGEQICDLATVTESRMPLRDVLARLVEHGHR